ncbi:LOW QUALITY PROTEIN: inactive tyrosine-protein kinase PEAK1 [Rhinatrema bivittatum]|uniref:LOW QUALITY PROTEIN: inactive tyrosine-protein kinase PEAK1 n=1 Tax=Rhinatrema bivittatum TaxID=194408 RepID=UPI001127C7DB|nr:LOW QUALITY PROTEIN: inactive tyrosine-protein kinase PEAK1 [Rhinatrema bivittatum]
MSACNTFTEHVWKPGECKNCFKPKSLHELPPSSEKASLSHGNLKTNANIRVRNTGSFRPPVAKKPTIAVKPTMMVVDGQGVCAEISSLEHCENKQIIVGWNRNRAILNKKTLNNNEDEIEGYNHMHRPHGDNNNVGKIPTNNNNGLTDVLKEIAGLDTSPQLTGNEMNARESFLGRINNCYKRSLERKILPSCMVAGMKDHQGKHVVMSGSTQVISNEGGRFCYPEFSSGDESEDDAFFGNMQEEHESWDESDEELLAMEIRMKGQPRFANFRANTLSPVRFCVDKKWNTVPLRNKSLQRICAVDYDDSYDEILNGYGEDNVIPYCQESMQSMVSSDSTSPDSSLTESSRSATTSSSSQKFCNGGLSPSTPKDDMVIEPDYESFTGDHQEKDALKIAKSTPKALETHKAVLALRLEEKDGKIAVQTEKQDGNKKSTDIVGQALTVSIVPVDEQPIPYRVVNLDQPVCKPYTVVDVSAVMTNEHLEGQTENSKTKSTSSTPSTPGTPVKLTASGQVNNDLKKSSSIQYQEVWTSSTSPRQKIPKVELITNNPVVPPRKCSHKSAPTSPTATNISSKTIPVKSPNLSEIKFNSYNNAGMPPFPIIIHDEPAYAKSSKKAIKVPIVINPNAYDNLTIYKSFLGTSGELSIKEKTNSVISHTYEEIETENKGSDIANARPSEFAQLKAISNSPERKLGSVAQKVQEFNSCLGKSQTSPQRSLSSSHNSPTKIQKTPPESLVKIDSTKEPCSSNRENAHTVLSQIVASIHPPQSPPTTPQSSTKACSVEELYSLPPDIDTTKSTLIRPKSLFSSQSVGETEAPKSIESTTSKAQKEPLQSTPVTIHPSKPETGIYNSNISPKSEQAPPFPPPRSTSSPYHASNLLQRHFSNWAKPSNPIRSTEAESVLHSETRRVTDAKPKRWISFKSFFRRRKADDDEDRERAREKGKLVGLDGTVIHMLPPPPVQRHHWFSETKTEASEKPSIVFMYRCESAPTEPTGDSSKVVGDALVEKVLANTGTNLKSAEEMEQQNMSNSSPPLISKKIIRLKKALRDFPLMGNCVSEYSSQVADEVTPEDTSPRVPRIPWVEPVKQGGGGSGGSSSATSTLLPNGSKNQDEKEENSDSSDMSPSIATYSNLGQSRANMIPPKQPRQVKGASDDAIAFGESAEAELLCKSQVTPPPLPKKTIMRANTEPTPRDFLQQSEQKSPENNLCVANPTYDIDTNWDTGSACSSVSSDAKMLDNESSDSLDRPLGKGRTSVSVGNSNSSLTAISIKERVSSMEYLSRRRLTHNKQSKSIQKPQRHALYRGIENREEVVGKIRTLHVDSLKKLAVKCEDLFMAGQKDQLRFGVDSWSDFRLTSDKPCCEAGDAIYYTASYAKDPLNNYAVKICKSKAKESQQQYYHSLAVRQSLAVNFNIQQDCGHFLADVPVRLLPWEDPNVEEQEDEEEDKTKETAKNKSKATPPSSEASSKDSTSSQGTVGKQRSRVVVITREVPIQTVADFVQESVIRHTKNPDLYERQVCLLLLQLCSGLEHLKPYHVTHCDLRLENLLLVHCRLRTGFSNFELIEPNPSTTCPARLIVSNFSQAKQKSHTVDPEVLRDQSRLAPEIITATQYKKCDEFQTGILIYEMLHLPNPFEENPDLKEKEYTRADLPPIPRRSLYSQGLQQLASCLLNPNPSERILISDAKGILRCLLWGPREDLFQTFSSASSPDQRDTMLQNWLDIKRTLLMIKFAERSLDGENGISLEDCLCSQYLAFATIDSLDRIVKITQQR